MQTIANIKLTIFYENACEVVTWLSNNNRQKQYILIAALIDFDLRYLTSNYIFNIFFNIQFVLEHFSP